VSLAFFIASLFLSIGVQIILRRDDPEQRPVGAKAVIVTIHLFISLGGIVAGFMMVCIVMIKFGRTTAGAVGLGLLSLIPLWVIVLFWFEWRHGLLSEEGPSIPDEQVDQSQVSNNKF
jgi:hypothetical protein